MRSLVDVSALICASALVFSSTAATALIMGDVLIAENGVGVVRVDLDSGANEFLAAGSYFDFIVADHEIVYAVDGDALVEINTSGGTVREIASGLNSSTVTAGNDGEVFVYDRVCSEILGIDPSIGSAIG